MLASDQITIEVHDRLPPEPVVAAAADAYLEGFAGPPYFETADDRTEFIDRLRRYDSRDGFRLVLARDGRGDGHGGRIVGIGLAVVARAGDWWRDRVAEALGTQDTERWLGDPVLEVVHLAVVPAARERGVGGAIHDAMLAGADAPMAVLSVRLDAEAARSLYRARGWRILRERISIAGREDVTLMVRPSGIEAGTDARRGPGNDVADTEPTRGAEPSAG